jgi:hypothetical protein
MSTTITQTMRIQATIRTSSSAPESTSSITPAANDATFQALARGDRRGTLKLRGIPEFTDLHDKRKWMKEHMAAAFRFFGKRGYGEGVSGHISMRGTLFCSSCLQIQNKGQASPDHVPSAQTPFSKTISG